MSRILLVDDDAPLLRALRINLVARGYEVSTATDGAAALAVAARTVPDLAVVDLGLPDVDGVTVVEGLRGWTRMPIIVLSARDGQAAKVDALDAGADDYVTKPFGMDEFLARVRAALRRAVPDDAAPVVATATFTVDLAAKRLFTTAGAEVRLTPRGSATASCGSPRNPPDRCAGSPPRWRPGPPGPAVRRAVRRRRAAPDRRRPAATPGARRRRRTGGSAPAGPRTPRRYG